MKVLSCYPGGKFKALTMSYDDGHWEDRRLVEIFNRYGIKGTFNLNYGLMEQNPKGKHIPPTEISQVYRGHEVATHTWTHPTLERCSLLAVADEILRDRKALEAETGALIRGHAYPNGSYTEEIKVLFQQLGIAYGRTVRSSGDFRIPTDPMEWIPTCRHNDPLLMDHAQRFMDLWRRDGWLQLMYVWGHSYEFTNDNNWELIEEFCRRIGGRDDIWYCTNIEFIDYMKVLRDLQYFASMEEVFNPSAASAWLDIGPGRVIEVKGGCRASLR